ncbi:MAG: type III secretion system chaperone [Pseudomonadota bacterium]
MTREDLDALMSEFGARIELPDFRLDENGQGCILTEKDAVFTFDYIDAANTLVIYTSIAEIVPSRRQELYGEMLKANFFWQETLGATLAVSPDGRFALLMTSISAGRLDIDSLSQVYLNMAYLTDAWYARIEEIFGDEPLPNPDDPESNDNDAEPQPGDVLPPSMMA